MTSVRIADGDRSDELLLINERELHRRVCSATASDMGRESAAVGLPVTANPFIPATPMCSAWRDAWLARRREVFAAGESREAKPQSWLAWLVGKLTGAQG
jgi:hypothetical protein